MEIGSNLPYIPNQDQTTNLVGKLKSAYTEADDKQLKEACQGFEAIFVNMMLSEMRKTVPESGLMESSFANDTFTQMLDEEIAESVSKGKGIGIADMMYKQISEKLKNTYKVEE
ncbi:MAG: rod-binding protein [Clostridia bacterium]|nr:rod-binding protein [Clostridia bacterium]